MRKALVLAAACGVFGIVIGRWTAPMPAAAAADASVANGDVNGDGTIDISDGIYILSWLFTGGPAPEPIECQPPGGGALPATGQTECYGYVQDQGWVAVPCEGAEIPGQDGAYQAGCPVAGRFVDHGDGTVTDTCTGLMWQKDTADVNGDGMVSPDWGSADKVTWTSALEYCEGLSFAGHDDWRLPNVRELQSFVDYGRGDPAIDPVFGAVSYGHWSSSTRANSPDFAWFVGFYDGVVYSSVDDKGFRFYVRAVRNAQ